ncbi:trigger factor [bacterium]|nr:trigger factor [candidate division CSSED10-310 bacterium]
MKINIERISDTHRMLHIEIDAERIDSEFTKFYDDLRLKARIPGFRPGKIPKNILKMRLGDEIAAQIGADLIQECIPEAMMQLEEETIGYPELGQWKVEEGKPLAFTCKVEVLPPLEVTAYKGVEIPRKRIVVDDEEIAAGLDRIRQGQATFEVVDGRGVETGDRVYGRITISVNNTPLAGWKNRLVEINVGSDTFFPGSDMETGLTGAVTGSDYHYSVSFPDDYTYYRDLAGKTAAVSVTVNDIKVKKIPEVNEDLAKDLGLENMAELREMVGSEIRNRKNREIDEAFEMKAIEVLSEMNHVPAPASLVRSEAEFIVESYFRTRSKLSDEETERLIESMAPMAERQVKRRLLLRRIAELEKITVTDEEMNTAFEELAESEGDTIENVKRTCEEKGVSAEIRSRLLQTKAMQWVKEHVVAVETDDVQESVSAAAEDPALTSEQPIGDKEVSNESAE